VWQMLLGFTLLAVIALAPEGIMGAWQTYRNRSGKGAQP